MMAPGHCGHRIIQRGRRFSRHPSPQILARIIRGVALYSGIYSIYVVLDPMSIFPKL